MNGSDSRLSAATNDPARLLARLEAELARYESLLVAFSGGVDSGLLLAAALRVLGGRAVAFTADSASMPRHELDEATTFAAKLGAAHVVGQTAEFERDEYLRNDRNRCYFCKASLFEECGRVARERGIAAIAYGYTRDDVGDHRPGHQAAREYEVVSPLADAGFGKAEIRAVARFLGLELADKPAAPCLSSRIPYGSAVTLDKLGRIEAMESLLREAGFRIFRARFDGTTMRLEFDEPELALAVQPDIRQRLLQRSRELQIPLLTIDLEGFRSGKLNRAELA